MDSFIKTHADSTMLPLVQEYESMIETLTTQVEFYANEQENLRKEISVLIKENKVLAQSVNEVLESQANAPQLQHSHTDAELVQNLKEQLKLSLKEKDTAVNLWQNALKGIDYLEEELKLFEGRTHGYFSKSEVFKIKQNYEIQLKKVEETLVKDRLKLENAEKNAENKNTHLKKALEGEKKTADLVKQFENEMKGLHANLRDIVATKDKLQITVDVKNGLIQELKGKNGEAKRKVAEAIEIVEAALFEKDAAILQEQKSKEEVLKISKTSSEKLDEATNKAKRDIEELKLNCDINIRKAQGTIQYLEGELKNKNSQLERFTKECKLLEEELERLRKGNINIDESTTSKLLILEKNLESTFQKLLLAEKKNLQMAAEKESIKIDMEQMADCYQNDIKTREMEKKRLQYEVQALRKHLKDCNSNANQLKNETNEIKSKTKMFDVEIKEKLHTKHILYKQAIGEVEKVQNINKKLQIEVATHLNAQVNLNKKWKKEAFQIIHKLESRLKKLKQLNKLLQKKLKQAAHETLHYKESLRDICANVKLIAKKNKDQQI